MLTHIMNQIPRITVNNFQQIWIEKLHVLNLKKEKYWIETSFKFHFEFVTVKVSLTCNTHLNWY